MNIRKPIDYTSLFRELDVLILQKFPQMRLYQGIGKLVSDRREKGAAVAAAEYLQRTYPNTPGFSPRSVRRMRDFYRTYQSNSALMKLYGSAGHKILSFWRTAPRMPCGRNIPQGQNIRLVKIQTAGGNYRVQRWWQSSRQEHLFVLY